MPDPARLTDEQRLEAADYMTCDDIVALQDRLAAAEKERDAYQDKWREQDAKQLALEIQLAAVENVVKAVRAHVKEHPALLACPCGANLTLSLAACDALKEPTGNHAESSTTRGDTHE